MAILIEVTGPAGVARAGETAPGLVLVGDGTLEITASKRTAQRVVNYKVTINAVTVARIEELLEKRRKAQDNG